MSIKFSCPNCSKPFVVKDQLAGKRAPCPACKKPLTIPKPSEGPRRAGSVSDGSAPLTGDAHIEELAAAALREEPAAAPKPAEEAKTVEFTCPQCDEPVQLSAELQGKQAPCPSCGRIVKVPVRVKDQPRDWRNKDTRALAGARRADEPAPEGAWGSGTVSAVSREALVGTAKPRRRPWTRRQKLLRGGFLTACVLVAAVATWLGFGWWGQRQQTQAYAKAMDAMKSDESKLAPEARAALFTHAGIYQVRTESAAAAKDCFQQARKLLGTAPNSLDRDLLLTDLALAQIDLGGDHNQAVQGLRVGWDDTAGEVRQTLQQLNDPEARAYAFRKISRKLIEKGQTDKIATLAQQLGAPKNAFNADPKAQAQIPPEAPELLGIAGLDLFRAGQTETAKKLAGDGLKLYKADGAAANPPVSVSLTALCVVLGMEPPKPAKAIDQDEPNFHVGAIKGLAWKGDDDGARQFAAQTEQPDVRWKALVAVASAGKDKPDAGALDDAIKLAVERVRDQRPLSPWWLLQMAEFAAADGNHEEHLSQLSGLVADAGLSGRISLEVLSAKLARTDGKADVAWGESVNKSSQSAGLAYLQLARHNAGRKALSVKDVDSWEEPLKPFGYLGVALGRQDRD